MVRGILGKKIGMSQIFSEGGRRTPVTLLETGPCLVMDIKVAKKHGYNSVQLGFGDASEKRVKKPQKVVFKAKGLKPRRFIREIRCAEPPDVKVGDEVTNSIFQKGDLLDVTGSSKGKGFQGGMKRCGWSGGPETHGSMSHRAPGSIGASSYPSRVFKGHPGPGHMGDERVTVQNLEVVVVDGRMNTVAVKGAVPGANGSYLIICFAKKKPVAPREVKEQEETVEEAVEETGEKA